MKPTDTLTSFLSQRLLRRIVSALFLILVVILLAAISYFRVLDEFEFQTYDLRLKLRGARPVSEDVVLIEIGDDSIKKIGRWPFDRQYHALLIDVLKEFGARQVGFDILFADESPGDAVLEKAAAKAGNVYFSYAFLDPQSQKGRIVSSHFLAPVLPDLEKAAKGAGHVNAYADRDGKRRRVPLTIHYNNKAYPQLATLMAAEYLGNSNPQVTLSPGEWADFGRGMKIPLDEEGYCLVSFAGKWTQTFRHISYADILISYANYLEGKEMTVDLRQLKGKVCFIGLTATGSHDLNPIPLESSYPMVGLHANLFNSILHKDFLVRIGRTQSLILLILLCLWVGFMSIAFRPLRALFFFFMTLFGYFGLSLAFFVWKGIWLDLFYPILLMFVVYLLTTLNRYMNEMTKRELFENELQIASQIQKSFLPSDVPHLQGLDIAAFMKPAKQVGGDFYSFVQKSPRVLGAMVGDVSGKGIPAALFMAKAVSLFQFHSRDKENPSEVLAGLNDQIATETSSGLFVTMTYILFNLDRQEVMLASAGHLPTLVVDSKGRKSEILLEEGLPIGLMEGAEYSLKTLPLQKGMTLALYSDGIVEARNTKKEEFQMERLHEFLARHPSEASSDLLAQVQTELGLFVGKAPQHDDITLVLMKT